MLMTKKMPKEFWEEAVDCAVYLSNRCPTRSQLDKTLQDAWSGRKPSASHLRVFGSIGYVHVPDQERSKLEDKSKSTSSLGMINVPKATNFTIQVLARSLFVEMWSLMKKMHGIGVLKTRRGMISFHFLMRRSKEKKFVKSPQHLLNHQPIQVHLLHLLQVHHLLQVEALVKGNQE